MYKKTLAVALTAALALPVMAWAQAKADFSGTWTFDEAKSDPAPGGGGGGAAGGGAAAPPGGGGGGRGGGGRGGAPASKLVIKQVGTNLTVESTMANGAQTAVYKLDGTENVNKTGMSETKSKATWEGNNLVIAGKQSVTTQQGNMELDVKEVYSISGNVLTITTTRVTPRGETTRKLVYNKG
jgi:hypothetical protein